MREGGDMREGRRQRESTCDIGRHLRNIGAFSGQQSFEHSLSSQSSISMAWVLVNHRRTCV